MEKKCCKCGKIIPLVESFYKCEQTEEEVCYKCLINILQTEGD